MDASPVLTRSVQVRSNSGNSFSGTLHYQEWPEDLRGPRARGKTLKIVGTLLGISCIGLFVHILLIVMIPLAILTLFASYPMYLFFKGDAVTFTHISGQCPYCDHKGDLKPYVKARVDEIIVVQCPSCGETSKAS